MAQAKVTWEWSERAVEVMYVAVRVFIFGVDVTNWVAGQVSVTLVGRGGWNTCSLTLANPEDVWVYSSAQCLAVRQALDAGGTSRPDPAPFRLGGTEYRVTEAAKYAIASRKASRLNPKGNKENTYRWEPYDGGTPFDKLDPIRIFCHHPRVAETDTDTPAWLPAFTGFLDNRWIDDKSYVTGKRNVPITGYDARWFLGRQRTQTSCFAGFHMGNRMIDLKNTIFVDVQDANRTGQALAGKKLEDAVQTLVVGGIAPTKVNPDNPQELIPSGPPRKSRYVGMGAYKLGKIVQLVGAPSPVAATNKQVAQLTGNTGPSGSKFTGDTKISAAAQKAIDTARANLAAQQAQQKQAQTQLAAAQKSQISGAVQTPSATGALTSLQGAVQAAAQAVAAAAGQLASAIASANPLASQDTSAPQAVPSAPLAATAPDVPTELNPTDISNLESWYALCLFGDWEDDIKVASAIQAAIAAGAPLAAGAAAPLGTLISSTAQAILAQSRGNPATTTTTGTQNVQPQQQGLLGGFASRVAAGAALIASNAINAAVEAARAATGSGAPTAGQAPSANGPATYRPLTFKEMKLIGEGTYWDGPFDPTAKKLYMLVPQGGTGNKSFADTTSLQGLGFHDRYFISLKEVMDGFLAGIDYQWYITPSGDVVVEPNMLDFQPEDFGKFAGVMTAQRHLIDGKMGDEIGDIPSVVQAVGAAQNPLATGPQATRRGQAFDEILIRRVGIGVKVVTYPFIGSQNVLNAAAETDLQKAVAHANNMDVSISHRPFLLPNKPIRHVVRKRLGVTSSVNHTWDVPKRAATRPQVDYVRRRRFDGRYLLITGGFDAPISGRRILPLNTLAGPSRTGVRSDLSEQNTEQNNANATDLKNAQVNEVAKDEIPFTPDPTA